MNSPNHTSQPVALSRVTRVRTSTALTRLSDDDLGARQSEQPEGILTWLSEQNSKTLIRSQHMQTAHKERLRVQERLLQHRKAHQATKSALMAVERATRDLAVPLSRQSNPLAQIAASSKDCQVVADYKALFNKQLGTIEHESQARCVALSRGHACACTAPQCSANAHTQRCILVCVARGTLCSGVGLVALEGLIALSFPFYPF